MKYILGVHTGHDRGAALIKDNQVIGVISQERLDRIKYSRSYLLPYDSMDALIEYFHISWNEILCIAIAGDAVEIENILSFLQIDFKKRYDINIPFFPVSHHLAHAYSTYFASGGGTKLVLVADGGGDFIGNKAEAESLYFGHDGTITLLEQRVQDPPNRKLMDWGNHLFPFMPSSLRKKQISLGRKYEQLTYLLNFKFGEAGKTMGLASYGKPMIDYSKINLEDLDFSLTYEDILKELYIKELSSGITHHEFLLKHSCDIASTVQSYIENAVVSLIRNLCHKYQIKNICLAGGLFLNCLTNHKIVETAGCDDVFIIPSAGDDGEAIGAALAACTFYCHPSSIKMELPYLGFDYSNERIENSLKCKNIKYAYLNDEELASTSARIIAEGKIIGIHRGKTEIGPRALCHRSILADATNPQMKDILNQQVKHREDFRPFAPVVTYEDQFKIFDLKVDSPYMLMAATVKREYRALIPAVTHVDYTARIQSIKKEEEPFIYSMLKKFEKIKGVPVILNTSFNVAGEPIVETPEDVIQTFLKTNIDAIIIGNYISYKNA